MFLPLGLLELPNEILVSIGELVKDDSTHSAIQSMRLTCRQLNNTVSHLLLNTVTLALNQRSLSRLLEISHHASIRRGVRTVDVSLLSYSSVLANSFNALQNYFTERLAHRVHQDDDRSYDYRRNVPHAALGRRMSEAMHTLWQYWTYSTELDEMNHRSPLGQVYRRYKQLFAEQTSLLEGSDFVSTVAAAFARMPFMRSLEFNDDESDRDYLLSGEPNVEKALLNILLLPVSWNTAKDWNLGTSASICVLLTLLGAMYRARCVPLERLEIILSRPDDLLFLDIVDEQDLHDIYKTVQDLKHFSLLPIIQNYIYGQRRHSEEPEPSTPFLAALLNTNTLDRLILNLGNWGDVDPSGLRHSIPFTTMIRPRIWNSLSRLYLVGFPMHLDELRNFMDGIPTSMHHMCLRNIRLISGTWAEALDILREKTYYSMTILSPTGNDFDDVWINDHAVFNSVFDAGQRDHPGLFKADAYVMKFLDYNPLIRENWIFDDEVSEDIAESHTAGELEWESTVALS